MAGLDRETALRWISRWDAQQQAYLPDREQRFSALTEAVARGAGEAPVLLDLGCGPGSLAVRLLARIPGARVVAIDCDPLLLALGRAAHGDLPGLRFAELDLREPGWAAALGLDRPADAAVSTTALHWLPAPALHAMYAELGTVLRPGGLLLNGDHLAEDSGATPVLAELGRALTERVTRSEAAAGGVEDWKGWWEAATADPALAGPAAQRTRRRLSEDHHGSESMLLAEHVAGLRAAGFTEIGTLWQHGENRILCAVRGG